MARMHANAAVDMTIFSSRVARVVSADEGCVTVRSGETETQYYGVFSYPDSGWEGTVTHTVVFRAGIEWWTLADFSLPTSSLRPGTDAAAAQRIIFSGNDSLVGSSGADTMLAYAGSDRMAGNGGADILRGGAGADTILGGFGRDALFGDAGADVIAGGRGNDRLAGGAGADTFVFGAADGIDRIADFGAGDRIRIDDGARRFGHLDIERTGDDVVVRFADTTVILEDVALRSIDAADFLF